MVGESCGDKYPGGFKELRSQNGSGKQYRTLHYALFSRRGFTDALKEKAARDAIGLFTVDNLVQG